MDIDSISLDICRLVMVDYVTDFILVLLLTKNT